MSSSPRLPQLAEPWRTSQFCTSSNCVEVALMTTGDVGMRDSKAIDGPVLHYSRTEFSAFVQGVKAGDFDDLC